MKVTRKDAVTPMNVPAEEETLEPTPTEPALAPLQTRLRSPLQALAQAFASARPLTALAAELDAHLGATLRACALAGDAEASAATDALLAAAATLDRTALREMCEVQRAAIQDDLAPDLRARFRTRTDLLVRLLEER